MRLSGCFDGCLPLASCLIDFLLTSLHVLLKLLITLLLFGGLHIVKCRLRSSSITLDVDAILLALLITLTNGIEHRLLGGLILSPRLGVNLTDFGLDVDISIEE